jgi:hypothetical protein
MVWGLFVLVVVWLPFILYRMLFSTGVTILFLGCGLGWFFDLGRFLNCLEWFFCLFETFVKALLGIFAT